VYSHSDEYSSSYRPHCSSLVVGAESDRISLMPIVAILVVLLVMVGCVSPSIPESSVTGRVHEVKIGEGITPKVIDAKTGNEVRWVNTRSSPVHISLKRPVSARLSCRNGFASTEGYEFVGSPDSDALLGTTVNSNGFASLCFSDSVIYNYAVTGTALVGCLSTPIHRWLVNLMRLSFSLRRLPELDA